MGLHAFIELLGVVLMAVAYVSFLSGDIPVLHKMVSADIAIFIQ